MSMAEWNGDTPHLPDYELRDTAGPMPDLPPPKRSIGLWLVVAGLVVAAAIAAYIAFGGRMTSAPVPAAAVPAPVVPPAAPVQPLGGNAAAVTVPPLDQSDAVVRDLVRRITSHPRIAAWLTTDGLIRNFVVDVSNVAEKKSPAGQLRALRPSSAFLVVERGGEMYVDSRSYERYDGLAAAAASVDPSDAASLYATLKPRIEEAYRDLGMPDTSFDQALERAIVVVLSTPIVDRPLQVVQRSGVGYGFADPALEALPPAQKQLLRMGPQNLKSLQSSFRAIAVALGIPATRLPAPRT
jgi:hypothetical protein